MRGKKAKQYRRALKQRDIDPTQRSYDAVHTTVKVRGLNEKGLPIITEERRATLALAPNCGRAIYQAFKRFQP